VKYWRTALAILAVLFASLALAEDFKTINGKEYKNATVTHVEADGIIVRTARGISKIYFVELPKDVADKWLAPIRAAERAAEENRIKEQHAAEHAAEEKRAAAERERTEKEKKAEAELKQLLEQFQAAEQRAIQDYRSATKGTLSGQVFVPTKGGENFKLGAVQVGLFDRNGIDAFIKTTKTYADMKIQELNRSIEDALAAKKQAEEAEVSWHQALRRLRSDDPNPESLRNSYNQAEQAANRARAEYGRLRGARDFYYTGAFYFSLLINPIQTAETDADGRFVIEVPQQGAFVIGAKAQRSVGDSTEQYYWLQPVSLEGQQKFSQNLSNTNLTSTTGTSSLIHTKD
jgi:hypothetical protein